MVTDFYIGGSTNIFTNSSAEFGSGNDTTEVDFADYLPESTGTYGTVHFDREILVLNQSISLNNQFHFIWQHKFSILRK